MGGIKGIVVKAVTVDVVRVYFLEILLGASCEEPASSGIWVDLAGVFPIGLDLGIHKRTIQKILYLIPLDSPKAHHSIAHHDSPEIDGTRSIQIVPVDEHGQIRYVLPGV